MSFDGGATLHLTVTLGDCGSPPENRSHFLPGIGWAEGGCPCPKLSQFFPRTNDSKTHGRDCLLDEYSGLFFRVLLG